MSIKQSVVACLVALGAVTFAGSAGAGSIFSATSASIDSGGPGFGSINDTFNQSGLLTSYASGVTDFDTYIAGNPIHDLVFAGNEWFSNQVGSAVVTYNFGVAKTFDALALWNEDVSGIGLLSLLTSNDGINFAPLVSGLAPPDNLNNANYGPDVFTFSAVTAQYVRFDMSRCPQEPAGFSGSCAIGEVAFRAASQVPEPASLLLVGLGLAGFGFGRRKKNTI